MDARDTRVRRASFLALKSRNLAGRASGAHPTAKGDERPEIHPALLFKNLRKKLLSQVAVRRGVFNLIVT